jgi:hypothetical protein
MKHLNFSNVEELIFYDRDVQNKLPPHMFSVFEQWRLARRVPFLRDLGKQALLDFLSGLNEEEDVLILEEYFGEKIIVERLNYNVVENIQVPLNESTICKELCEIEGFNHYNVWRDADFLYISFWR